MTAVTAFSRTAYRRRRSCPRRRRRPWAARLSPDRRWRRRRRGRSPSSCFSADISPRCFAPWRGRAGRQTPTSGSCWGCSYLIHLQIQLIIFFSTSVEFFYVNSPGALKWGVLNQPFTNTGNCL